MNNYNIKALVYPYDSKFTPILNSDSLLKDIKIVGAVSPIGWGLCGKKITQLTETSDSNFTIMSSIDDFEPASFDSLLIVGSDKYVEDKTLINQVCAAASIGKNIIISKYLSVNVKNSIAEICSKYNIKLELNEPEAFAMNYAYGNRLFDIHTPIITVSGIGENCDKFEVQIELRKRFVKLGYKVCSISSTYELIKNLEILPFPNFMRGTEISESDKIITYNHYVHHLEQQEKPDVFIIGIPGGIMPITRLKTAYFGINSFDVYNAINPDFTIMNLYCGECSHEYITELSKIFKYKFNADIDCFFISNHLYDSSTLNGNQPTRYLVKDDTAVSEQVKLMSNYNCDIFCRETYNEMAEHIINKLGSYDDLKVL